MRTDKAPDTPEKRLTRIETKLEVFQRNNSLALDDVQRVLKEVRDELIDLKLEVRDDT